MSAFYFDSSGLVKRYLTETGSNWVIGLLKPSATQFLLRESQALKSFPPSLAAEKD